MGIRSCRGHIYRPVDKVWIPGILGLVLKGEVCHTNLPETSVVTFTSAYRCTVCLFHVLELGPHHSSRSWPLQMMHAVGQLGVQFRVSGRIRRVATVTDTTE